VSKIKEFYDKNRFLVWLIVILISASGLTLWLGYSSCITGKWRDLFSSLTPELIGAVIGVLVIDQLLKKHQERSFQGVRVLVSRRIYAQAKESVIRAAATVPRPKDDPTFVELLDMINTYDFSSATARLDIIFGDLNLLKHPSAFEEIKRWACNLLAEWRDSQMVFQPYLTPEQFASITKIIGHLESLDFECGSVELFLEQWGSDVGMRHLTGKLRVVDSLKALGTEALGLLELCVDRRGRWK